MLCLILESRNVSCSWSKTTLNHKGHSIAHCLISQHFKLPKTSSPEELAYLPRQILCVLHDCLAVTEILNFVVCWSYRESGWRMIFTLNLNGTRVDRESFKTLLLNTLKTDLDKALAGSNIKVSQKQEGRYSEKITMYHVYQKSINTWCLHLILLLNCKKRTTFNVENKNL